MEHGFSRVDGLCGIGKASGGSGCSSSWIGCRAPPVSNAGQIGRRPILSPARAVAPPTPPANRGPFPAQPAKVNKQSATPNRKPQTGPQTANPEPPAPAVDVDDDDTHDRAQSICRTHNDNNNTCHSHHVPATKCRESPRARAGAGAESRQARSPHLHLNPPSSESRPSHCSDFDALPGIFGFPGLPRSRNFRLSNTITTRTIVNQTPYPAESPSTTMPKKRPNGPTAARPPTRPRSTSCAPPRQAPRASRAHPRSTTCKTPSRPTRPRAPRAAAAAASPPPSCSTTTSRSSSTARPSPR